MAINAPSESATFDGYHPLSQEFLRDPYPTLARARAEQPVFFYPEMGFWVVTRYDDLVEITKNWQVFSQSAARLMPTPPELRHRITEDWFEEAFMNADPPVHTPARKIVNGGFTRSRVAAAEPRIRAIADDLIDAFIADGSCEFMSQFAYPMGSRTLATFVGLPEEEMPRIKAWAQDLLVLAYPRSAPVDESGRVAGKDMAHEELVERWSRMADCREYLHALVDEREARPQDDLLSLLVAARDADGERVLSKKRVVTHLIDLIAAGADTVAPLMAHTLKFLVEHPDQLAAVRADPSLLEGAIEEGLRIRGTGAHLFRYTTADAEVGGVTIPAGSVVALSYASGGHDEAHFGCPAHFDVRRENADDHLAFGRGRHFCIGAPLARLEARVSLGRLIERLPDLRLEPGQTLGYHPAIAVFMLQSIRFSW